MVASTLRDERLALVERLRGLAPADWDRPSLCAGWSVRHVVAHLVTPLTVSVPSVALAVARRGGVSAGMDALARRLADRHEPAELLALLTERAGSTRHPPGLPLAAPLTDAVAHAADIRWALGDPTADWGAPERLRPALDFLVSPRAAMGFVPPGRLRGLALAATDLPWRAGAGAEVRGPALSLAMAVLGRGPALLLVTGDGASTLADRVGPVRRGRT